ncbi:transmembrane protein 176A isoform X4 [Leptonychotes weddellii]|uniref:Transmembrane protein 176A isoform X4 n=1 Tax=Leptonychotes weddellii TaxID=9713 RepID=A0A7F8QJA1_LEPWE|nr:transmembrane protein 176A isoform X4 [Leptonychotes weddellii]
MSAGMGTVDGGEADPGTPQPTHIHVHIHQESALATLLIRGCSLLRSPAPGATSQTWGRSRLLVASWVVQIVLGVLSGVLGSFLQIFYGCTLCGSGTALWTGAVAVLAGAVAFIYEKRGGIYWALFISFPVMLLGVWVLLLLASLVPLCLYCWRRSRCKKETDQKKLLEIKRPRRAKTISLSCETQIRSWTRQAFGPESSPAGRAKPETTGRMKQALCSGQVLSLKSEDRSTNLGTATY